MHADTNKRISVYFLLKRGKNMLIAWAKVWADVSTRHVARGKWLVKKGTPPLQYCGARADVRH